MQLERARFTTHAEILAIHVGFGKLKRRYPVRPDVYENFAFHARILGVFTLAEEEEASVGEKKDGELQQPEPERKPVTEIAVQPEPESEPNPEPEPQPTVSHKRRRPQSQDLRNLKNQASKPKQPTRVTRVSKRTRHQPPPSPPPLSKRKAHTCRHRKPGNEVLINRIPELPPPRRKYGEGRTTRLDSNMFLEICARERRKNKQWGIAGKGGCLLQRNLWGREKK